MKKLALKKLLKIKAKEHAFDQLVSKKEGHSKISNINYEEIKMKDYLKSESIRLQKALNLFKCRTRMKDFGENFRAGANEVP